MKNSILLLPVMFLCFVSTVKSQTEVDTVDIKAAVIDYVDGWWNGDAERMERSLHPNLVKRFIHPHRDTGRDLLSESTKYALVEYTRGGGGKNSEEPKGDVEIVIFDIESGNADVKVWSAKY